VLPAPERCALCFADAEICAEVYKLMEEGWGMNIHDASGCCFGADDAIDEHFPNIEQFEPLQQTNPDNKIRLDEPYQTMQLSDSRVGEQHQGCSAVLEPQSKSDSKAGDNDEDIYGVSGDEDDS
jgi:hypothetical protein